MVRYCLPIVVSSTEELQSKILGNEKDYQVFEIWLDYLQGDHPKIITELVKQLGKTGLFLLRRLELETAHCSWEDRCEMLQTLAMVGAWVDLDVRAQTDELDYIERQGLKLDLLGSYHNYQRTPERCELDEIIVEMEQRGASIFKIATFCQNHRDALQLLDLLLDLKEAKKRCVVLGMGPKGIPTRVVGPLWGNDLIYAPTQLEQASAPGQLTRANIDGILKMLG